MISDDKIQRAIDLLVNVYNPVAIYLFGSYAWGEPTEDSDLDFMVIVSDRVKTDFTYLREKRVIFGQNSFKDKYLDFPIDILVNTKSKFFANANHIPTLQFKILNEGKEVYRHVQTMVA